MFALKNMAPWSSGKTLLGFNTGKRPLKVFHIYQRGRERIYKHAFSKEMVWEKGGQGLESGGNLSKL